MKKPDEFSQYYKDYLENTYDCVDRIVLNAYFILAQSTGGFRTWWRRLMDGDEKLNNTNLMRFASKFSRRIHAYAKKEKIPLIHCKAGDRKHEIAEEHIPKDPTFQGVFCILAGRAQAPVWEIKQSCKGNPHIIKKKPLPYVNHYSFHIMDPEWGHMTIKLCPHPPFNAQIILNGHEYVAIKAKKENISFTKEDNCFISVNNAAGLARVADTMRAPCSVGRLAKACDRWIYSACLCFALDMEEQGKTGFHYSYSVYQAEYSRNLLFIRGHTMDKVFHGVIDRTRSLLNMKSIKTIFGYKHRPFFKCGRKGKSPRFEVVVERPVYDLTVFKVHFGKLTVKMYSKGERVLRIEVVAHNTKDLRCGRVLVRFSAIAESLKEILNRFLSNLRSVDISFISEAVLETWPQASVVGTTRVGGIDVNRRRIRSVMKGIIALSIKPQGFTASDLAEKVKEVTVNSKQLYQSRMASYDLKKLRGKKLVRRIGQSRRYEATQNGLRNMTAFIVLREKVLMPLLTYAAKCKTGPKTRNRSKVDTHYENIQTEMKKVFNCIGIAA
jgi:hypothetical protein